MIPYILNVTVITTICFLFYKLFLQKETFYRLNRWMLMGSLAIAFVLPLLPVPQQLSWRGRDVQQEVADAQPKIAVKQDMKAALPVDIQVQPAAGRDQSITGSGLAARAKVRHRHPRSLSAESPALALGQASTVSTASGSVVTATPAPVIMAPANAVAGHQSELPEKRDPLTLGQVFSVAAHWLFYVYLFGVLLFGMNFLLQLAVLLYQSYANPVIVDGRFRIIETGGNRAPCSFGNTIFINPAAYDWETYNQILIHEKTHVSGRHTVDILLAEAAVVLQWFNPIVWWYRREVENNLEFLTDESVLLHEEVERSAYQLSLLRVSAPHLPFSITNNYNQSLLKRRIVMMNSKRSSRHTVWKYFFLLPIFTALVCVLNKPAVYGQQSKSGSGKTAKKAAAAVKAEQATPVAAAAVATPAMEAKPANEATPVAQDTTARPVSASGGSGFSSGSGFGSASGFSDDFTIEPLNISFAAPVMAISARPAISTRVAPLMALSTEPLVMTSPLVSVRTNLSLSTISVDADVDDLTDGSWFITTTDGKLWFELKAEEDDHSWSHSMTVDKSEINPFPGMGNVSFKLTREAGTMSFTGQFDGQQGFGHFHFQGDEVYFKAMTEMGVEDLDSRRQISLFLSNVKKDYASMVVHNGYPHIRARELVSLSAMHIDQEFIQYWHGSGLAEADEPRTLVTLKAQNIDKSYVEELKAAGYDHLTARELVSLKSQRINGAYVRSMGRRKDNEAIPVRELISYKAMKIDSDYLATLRKLGYADLEPREVTSLYSMHITADFIKGFQDLGYKDIPVRDLMTLKSMAITPEYVKGFRDIGIKELSPRELNQFKAMKITPDFVKGFRDIGYEDIPPSRLGSLKSMGITPEFVGEFKKIGFDNIPMSMLPSLKAMGVNAEYISKMREKGFMSKDLNKYIRLKNDFN